MDSHLDIATGVGYNALVAARVATTFTWEIDLAHSESTKKRHRQSLKRRERNRHRRSTLRSAVRQVQAAAATGDGEAQAKFANAERLLRKGVTKGVMHQKTASRTISRLHKIVSSQPATS